MTRLNRRRYLKASLAATGGLVGVGGARTVFAQLEGNSQGQGGNTVSNRGCPSGTVQLAKYEAEEMDDVDDFVFEEGDDAITFTSITRDDEGEITAFEWISSEYIAVVVVKFGLNIEFFQGGFSGSVDLSDEQNAISNAEFCVPRGGRAVLCELDMNGEYNTEMHLESAGGRSGVLQITSRGNRTTDYAHSMVNVLPRLNQQISIENIENLTLEYFEGEDNEKTGPGEVFVSFIDNDDLKLAVRTVNSQGGQGWHEVDVAAILEETWSVVESGFDELRSSSFALETARNLKKNDNRVVLADVVGDATLAGVGVGAASTRSQSEIERYYDNLSIDSTSFDFPATVPADVVRTFTQGNDFVVALELQQTELGVNLEDTVTESVKLSAFGPFSPPIEPGVGARNVRQRAGQFEVIFDESAVNDLLESSGIDNFIVSGDFDVANGSAFFGVGSK